MERNANRTLAVNILSISINLEVPARAVIPIHG